VSDRALRVLEVIAIVVASLIVSVGAIVLLSGYFAGKDQAGVNGTVVGPGQAFKDLGDQHLPLGRLQPPYNSSPPTSGAHVPQPVTRDEAKLSDNQLLQALELGNVVVMYGTRTPPPGLRALAAKIAGPFTPALAATGEAVILARRPGIHGLVGLAWTHLIRTGSASDPLLSQFAEFWLGKGAPGRSSGTLGPAG
jgi:uncharacterized protein DUF3105